MNKLVKTVSSSNMYQEFLHVLNGILSLTDRELELFTMLVSLDVNYEKEPEKGKNIVNTANRKLIMNELGITRDNLCRYISKFKSLGYIVKGKSDGEWLINRALIPIIINDRVQITIILKVKDERKSYN